MFVNSLCVVALSPMFPSTLMVGMEIRVKVSDYVMDRIAALRQQHEGNYQNIACIRTNAMKYLPNYFSKGQVSTLCHVDKMAIIVVKLSVNLRLLLLQ